MHHLDISGLNCSYGALPVLRDVHLKIGKGDVVSLIGPSGSGKSTLLRTLVGLLLPQSGEVLMDGTRIDYRSPRSVKLARDRMAIVFQQYNLFQNMDALRNVTIAPLKIKRRNRAEVDAEARRSSPRSGSATSCTPIRTSFPAASSSASRSRARWRLRPEILLLDKPPPRSPECGEVLEVIRGLAEEGMTMLVVTREMAFVREISTHVVMMDRGAVVEEGTPAQNLRILPDRPMPGFRRSHPQ